LAHDLGWVAVVAQALEGGSAQDALGRPLGELNLSDQPRLHEHRSLRRREPALEGLACASKRRELLREFLQRAFGEAGPHATRERQLAVLEVANKQRADAVRAPPLPRQPTTDHELLAETILDLQPRSAAPAWLIARAQPLGDDSFQASLPRRLQQAGPRSAVGGGNLPGGAAEAEVFEPSASPFVGNLEQSLAVEVEQIEDRVDDRNAALQTPDRRRRGDMHAALKPLE